MSLAPPFRLLIVEDDPFYTELVRVAAAATGRFTDIEAVDGGPAALDRLVALAQEHGPLPDAILSDLKMPDVDGLELLAALREHDVLRRIPVVIMSSSELPADRNAALRAGCRHFFRKPASIRQLGDQLRALPEICLEEARVAP
jgi:CheY-like chemotaxis protein